MNRGKNAPSITVTKKRYVQRKIMIIIFVLLLRVLSVPDVLYLSSLIFQSGNWGHECSLDETPHVDLSSVLLGSPNELVMKLVFQTGLSACHPHTLLPKAFLSTLSFTCPLPHPCDEWNNA